MIESCWPLSLWWSPRVQSVEGSDSTIGLWPRLQPTAHTSHAFRHKHPLTQPSCGEREDWEKIDLPACYVLRGLKPLRFLCSRLKRPPTLEIFICGKKQCMLCMTHTSDTKSTYEVLREDWVSKKNNIFHYMGKYACSRIDVLWWCSELVSYFIICITKINKQFTRLIFIQQTC